MELYYEIAVELTCYDFESSASLSPGGGHNDGRQILDNVKDDDMNQNAIDLSGIDLSGLDFDGLEIVTVADGLAMPEMGASISTCSCGSSSTCCSCYSCYAVEAQVEG